MITPEIVAEHGFSPEEYQRLLHALGREPNLVELGIFSVMWSEHCSYKSSRVHLKKLPTEAPWVICGPGENAGVIDVGEGPSGTKLAAIFKMESHNHPSYIEPYQGAATGVGGILRDVFTMGARPVANLNTLRFGRPDHPKTRHLVAGVVAGIGGYGNCVGVPTVGGEVNFDAAYDGNILVNAMTVGIADQDKIFYSAASGVGNSIVYVGSKTGRDGIHGATMASADFSEDSEEKRPTVQVGDPFTEKLLIEACLELMASDAIVAIQDMGAAGLTSSSVEMASKGGVGIRLDMNAVPCREEGMTPYEMMLSESQERMLMVLKPGREDEAEAIFRKWELDFAVIGEVTDTGRMELVWNGETVADIPLGPLADEAPLYERPYLTQDEYKAWAQVKPLGDVPESTDIAADLLKLMASPAIASRRWIWEQYDSRVGGDTVQTGGDAAVVRIHGTKRALAMTTDCTPRYCYADPVEGGKQAIAEAYRNLCAVGAKPLAVTNCLNFGNPQRPEIMAQVVGCLEGMSEACIALDMPIVSGNVSLYNETKNDDGTGSAILPTPAIGAVGVIEDWEKTATIGFKDVTSVSFLGTSQETHEGARILLLGTPGHHVAQSLWSREIHGRTDGLPPKVELIAERKVGEFVRSCITDGSLIAAHDVSDGGVLVTIAEMALAGKVGAFIFNGPWEEFGASAAFAEDQGLYVVSTLERTEDFLARARAAGVPAMMMGRVGGIDPKGDHRIVIDFVASGYDQSKDVVISLTDLRAAYEGFFPKLMGADAALA
ncbi:MAG: phosphoribosylformylglycinamidine synthase subunit PurL [Sphingomicrobium sp.]|nr:phosphoribosylformylglycinamidine synthase subunit PurL [Sphingomonadales bacterium]